MGNNNTRNSYRNVTKSKESNEYSWSEMRTDIPGESKGDQSGSSISMSSDGTILAIGSPTNDGNNSNSGCVKVYKWISDKWIQRGNDIDGDSPGYQSGYSVSLSGDGNILAIGSPYSISGTVKIYKFENDTWIQMGNNINGENEGDRFGFYLDLSFNGDILAVASPWNTSNTGSVRVYNFQEDKWIQMGNDIDGKMLSDQSGFSLSLSSGGTILAIGSLNSDINGSNSGTVRVYKWDSESWNQRGNDINGEGIGDQSGYSVDLSADGHILAIGSPNNNSNTGSVRVYRWNISEWVQIGTDIDGKFLGERSGYSVKLSASGHILALGAPYNSSYKGVVRIYKLDKNIWIQIGTDIVGKNAYEYTGYTVTMSSDGKILTVGVPFNNSYMGIVRTYLLSIQK